MSAAADVANLYLTTECDMNCLFCYASKGIGRLPFEQAQRVIDALAERGARRLNITGGEVLLHPDALSVVRYAAGAGLSVTLFTSGSLYDERRVQEFSPHIAWLAVSLDGDADINRAMGRSPAHFGSVLHAMRLTRAHAPWVSIRVATVVTAVNLDHLFPLAEILVQPEHAPHLWRIKQMVPTRRGAENEASLGIKEGDFKERAIAVQDAYGDRLRIEVIGRSDKESDTLCIHPDGRAMATLSAGDAMRIQVLGNVFEDLDRVLTEWHRVRHTRNASRYALQWRGGTVGE